MPGVDRECVTHHYACDCREDILQRYIENYEKYILAWVTNTLTQDIIDENAKSWEELKKLKH